MSPRNTPQGVVHMLKTVGCTRIVAHATTAALFRAVQDQMKAEGIAVRVD